MLHEIRESNPPVSDRDLAAFEGDFGLVLPERFRKFLLTNNGGRSCPAGFPIRGLADNLVGTIQVFFGLNAEIKSEDFRSIMTDFRGLVPKAILPIACTDGDDFMCIDMRSAENPIVFWDRRPFWGSNEWNDDDLYPVADNFELFLASFHEPQF